MAEPSSATTTQSAVPPYVPYRSFRNFIDGLKQGIPSRIDRSVMPSMSGALQSQLTAALRYLGLIFPSGQPTALLPRLVHSEGAERANVLREMLAASYPFLTVPSFDTTTATPRMMEEQFANVGASGGTIDKCMNFYLAAAKEAQVGLSPHLKNTRGTRGTVRMRQRSSRVIAIGNVTNGEESPMATTDPGDLTWAQMLLSKFPSFDPSWSPEVQAKWFDAFDKLMKQGEANEQ